VVLDARGEAVIYGSGAYKVVTKDASGTTIRTVDNYKIFPISTFAETILDDANAEAVRTTLGLGTAAVLDAGTNPNNVVQLDANNPARLPAVDGRALDLTNMPDANLPASALAFPRSYLAGLSISNSTSGESPDADHDIDIAAGECRDSTHTANIALANAITKQLDADWAEGTHAGGLDGGAVQANTWYHVFAIKNTTSGTADIIFSTDSVTPTLPNGYTKFRRIGAIRTDSNGVILKFLQWGDEFTWVLPVVDVNVNDQGTTSVAYTLDYVPYGIKTKAKLYLTAKSSAESLPSTLYVHPYDTADIEGGLAADTKPSVMYRIASYASTCLDDPSNPDKYRIFGNASSTLQGVGDNGPDGYATVEIVTNEKAQIKVCGATAHASFMVQVMGWIDRRGRDD